MTVDGVVVRVRLIEEICFLEISRSYIVGREQMIGISLLSLMLRVINNDLTPTLACYFSTNFFNEQFYISLPGLLLRSSSAY